MEPEEELDEEEPQLKYQTVGADLARIVEKESASCVTLHESFVLIGTKQGRIYMFDFNGHELRRFRSHTKQVNDVCIDQSGEFICSGGEDGLVIVNSLSSPESVLYNYYRPVYAAQCDPLYSKKREKVFVAGGSSGQLALNKRGWLIENETIVDEGEGPIDCIRWKGSLIAWANQWGVKVYDVERQQRVTFIEKPQECPPLEVARCCLFWESDATLLVGWGDTIKVLEIKRGVSQVNGTISSASQSRYGELVAIFQMDFIVTGISAWDAFSIAVLGYVTPETVDVDDGREEAGEGKPLEVPLPELHLISRDNGEDVVCDALPIKGYEKYSATDYKLASTYGFHHMEDSPILYIVSPKELVVARTPSPDDRISWSLSRQDYGRALRIAQASPYPLKKHRMTDLVDQYLGSLMDKEEYDQAASECPSLLGENTSAWEKWLMVFAQKDQIGAIAPFVPLENPRLGQAQYEMILLHFLERSPKHLLQCFRQWPKPKRTIGSDEQGVETREEDGLYDTRTWITRLENLLRKRDRTGKKTEVHITDSLAELYCAIKDYDKALQIYLVKGADSSDSAHIFELIKTHGLWDSIQDKVLPLFQLDKDRAADLLARNVDRIPVTVVVDQLEGHPELQHLYLLNLFEKCPDEYNREIYVEFHDLQTSLLADFAPDRLLKFLQVSNYVSLEKALAICKDHEPPLYDATIFILGRLGRTQEALDLLITKVSDVHKAIEFVQDQEDNLWDYLIQKSLQKASFLSELLDYAGSHGVDPAKLVSNIPEGMEISHLREKLVKIMQDYNQQVTLREGSSSVFASDCTANLRRLLREKSKGLRADEDAACRVCQKALVHEKKPARPGEIILFFCGHYFHQPCLEARLKEITDYYSKRKKSTPKDFENGLICSECNYNHYVPKNYYEGESSSSVYSDQEILFGEFDLPELPIVGDGQDHLTSSPALSSAQLEAARQRLVLRQTKQTAKG